MLQRYTKKKTIFYSEICYKRFYYCFLKTFLSDWSVLRQVEAMTTFVEL